MCIIEFWYCVWCEKTVKSFDYTPLNISQKTVQVTELQPNMAIIGKSFKKDSKEITKVLKGLNEEEVAAVEAELESKGY